MKQKRILSLFVAFLFIFIASSSVSAAGYTFDDLVDVSISTGTSSVTVEYSLTQLAIDEGFSFTTTNTWINGHEFNTPSFTATYTSLGLTRGSTTTGDYYVEVSRDTTVPGEPLQHTIYSNTEVTVATYGSENYLPSTEAWVHPLWDSTYSGSFSSSSSWIWNSYYALYPVEGEILEFNHTFNVEGTPTGQATLTIVADNGYQAKLNNILIGTSSGLSGDWIIPPLLDEEVQSDAWKTDLTTHNVSVVQGANILDIVAVNEYQEGGTIDSNPAGLRYELTYYTATTDQGEPEYYGNEGTIDISVPTPPTPPPTPTYYDLVVTSTEGGSVPGFDGTTSTFTSGTNVNLGITTEEGYQFVGWNGDSTSTDGNIVVIMTSDKAVHAIFEPIPTEPEEPEEPIIEEEILDEEIVEATPNEEIPDEALPQTGGLPLSLLMGSGMLLSSAGFVLKHKKL